LTRCAHVIISFGRAGAIRMSRRAKNKGEREFRLYYDPKRLEGDWEESSSGKMIGDTITLTASIARELLLRPEAPVLDQAIQSGVAAQRRLFEVGYGKPVMDPDQADLAFPSQTIADELAGKKRPIEVVEVREPLRQPRAPSAASPSKNPPTDSAEEAKRRSARSRTLITGWSSWPITRCPQTSIAALVVLADGVTFLSQRSYLTWSGSWIGRASDSPTSS
jgi:hypothetical protein